MLKTWNLESDLDKKILRKLYEVQQYRGTEGTDGLSHVVR